MVPLFLVGFAGLEAPPTAEAACSGSRACGELVEAGATALSARPFDWPYTTGVGKRRPYRTDGFAPRTMHGHVSPMTAFLTSQG